MNSYDARVRKLITAFNTLSDENKNALLERMETLKQSENAVSEKRSESSSYMRFANGGFDEIEKLC